MKSEEFAAEIHGTLADAIPAGIGAERSTPTSPFLRVRLGDQAADEIRTNYLAGARRDPEHEDRRIRSFDSRAGGSGGPICMQLGPGSTLGDVLADWRQDDSNTGQEARWFDALTDQMEAALVGEAAPG